MFIFVCITLVFYVVGVVGSIIEVVALRGMAVRGFGGIIELVVIKN